MPEDLHLRLNPLRSAPNLLTLVRICMAPFLVAAILEGHYLLSFTLFVAAGLTDAFDGLLARALKQRSMLGHYLDPVADKLLLSTLFLVLFYKGLIPATVTVLVFGRDVGILLVAALLYAAVGRREFHPSIFGKANTLAQICAVASVLLHQLISAALGRGDAHCGARRYYRADHSLGPSLRMAGVAPHRSPGSQRRRRQIRHKTPQPRSSHESSARKAFRNRRGDPRFQPCLQFPYREILLNRRPRHTPGTRRTRCHRAGKRFGP